MIHLLRKPSKSSAHYKVHCENKACGCDVAFLEGDICRMRMDQWDPDEYIYCPNCKQTIFTGMRVKCSLSEEMQCLGMFSQEESKPS